MVFYTIFTQMFLHEVGTEGVEPVTAAFSFILFFRMALGGLAVGFAFAIGLVVLLRELDRRLEPEFDVV